MSSFAPDPTTPDHAAKAAEHLQDAAYEHGQPQAVALALASVEANLATAQAVERLNDNMAELAQGLASGFARFAETFGPTLAALAEAVSRPEVAAELRTANLIAYSANVSREVRWATSNGFAIDSPLAKAATEDASNAARMAREALGF